MRRFLCAWVEWPRWPEELLRRARHRCTPEQASSLQNLSFSARVLSETPLLAFPRSIFAKISRARLCVERVVVPPVLAWTKARRCSLDTEICFGVPRIVSVVHPIRVLSLKNSRKKKEPPCPPPPLPPCFVGAAISALEVIPYTLAENAGMNPISIVTELRSEHAKGKVGAGEPMNAFVCLRCSSQAIRLTYTRLPTPEYSVAPAPSSKSRWVHVSNIFFSSRGFSLVRDPSAIHVSRSTPRKVQHDHDVSAPFRRSTLLPCHHGHAERVASRLTPRA